MPREIFADEIERFLQGLEGVSSARVLTGPAGEISYVYVTTESAHDSRGLRHGVVAALQSRFSIPVEEWRVRVTQLRAGLQPVEIPRFRVVRVEETASAADIAVTVKLQWTRGSDVRSAIGQARGRGGSVQRPRTLAAAALAAVRDALDVSHADLTLERVGTLTFLDRPVMLVALSSGGPQSRGAAGAPSGPPTFVGTAFDDAALPGADDTVEPAITATLDAVTRWMLHAALVIEPGRSMHRRERLEAMRHFVLDATRAEHPGPDSPAEMKSGPAERVPADPVPTPERPTPESPAAMTFHFRAGYGAPAAAEAGGAPAYGGLSRIAPGRPLPRRFEIVRNGHDRAGPSAGVDSPRETGPHTRGETAMGLQQDTSDAPSGVRAARSSGVEDNFYRSLVLERTPVHLRCRDGYEVHEAIIRDAGTYALLVETPEGLELFFKHAIISVRVLPKAAAQA
ncbi:MAG TPA: hypothetical protein VJT33_05375 [bacterium]|nr:hypothetical protein [bacterium]